MDPVSFAFGTAAAAQLCLSIGAKLVDKYRAYKTTDKDVTERLLELMSIWYKIEKQVAFVSTIWNEMEEPLQIFQHYQLIVLRDKLNAASSLIDELPRDTQAFGGEIKLSTALKSVTRLGKIKYSFIVKDRLKQSIDQIRKWAMGFDPSWYLIIRIQKPSVDRHLSLITDTEAHATDTVRRLRDPGLVKPDVQSLTSSFHKMAVDRDPVNHISFSFASELRDKSSNDGYIVDRIPLHYDNMALSAAIAEKSIKTLASILSQVDTDVFGVLACHEIAPVKGEDNKVDAFNLIYRLPSNTHTPRSLREMLLQDDKNMCFLNQRLHFAQSLARSLIFLHNAKILHKNISPDSIIVVQDSGSELGRLFLIGFRDFRFESGATVLRPDTHWERNLYRHPLRQYEPQERYRMQHDMYSLGVCLLEIGLWTSLVQYDGATSQPKPSLALDGIDSCLKERNLGRRARRVKSLLLEIAEESLPSNMGMKYTAVVKSCLTCLDRKNLDFVIDDEQEDVNDGETDTDDAKDDAGGDDEAQEDDSDRDGTIIGVRYIEKIINEINRICL